jgi:hypothetical protein
VRKVLQECCQGGAKRLRCEYWESFDETSRSRRKNPTRIRQPAYFLKLRRKSGENIDFSGPKGALKKLFSGRNRVEIPSGLKIDCRSEKALLSALLVAGFMQYAG